MELSDLLKKIPKDLRKKLKTPPSVIRENKFNEKGLVETASGLLVPAYVASPLGFNFPGRYFLETYFYPRLREECMVLPLCPFTACAEYLDFSKLNENMPVREEKEFWKQFNRVIGAVNYGVLFPKSKFLIALCEGHYVDEGVAAEIAHFADDYGKVIAVRSDFRLAENRAAPINLAIEPFIDKFRCGPTASENVYIRAFKEIKDLADKIREESVK